MPVLRDLISSTKKILTLEAAGKTFWKSWNDINNDYTKRTAITQLKDKTSKIILMKKNNIMEENRFDTRKIQWKRMFSFV